MAFKKAIRLFSILVLISVFIYWAIGAYIKYEQEPISSSTEYRLGDDDLGNFSLPVISFFSFNPKQQLPPKCNKIHEDKVPTEGMTGALISCMQDYDNVTAFLEDMVPDKFIYCKYEPIMSFRFTYVSSLFSYYFPFKYGTILGQTSKNLPY